MYRLRSTAMRFSRAGQLVLQPQEILVGFQLRIVFNDGQQSAEGAVELAVGGDFVLRCLGAHQCGSGRGDVVEDGLLLCGISFHRLDEVGNQVGAPLQNNVHLRPLGFHCFVFHYHLIAAADIHPAENQCD